MVRYGGSKGKVPLRIHELVSYVQDVPGPTYQAARLAQAQSIKRVCSTEWDIVAHNIAWRIPLPIRVETPNTGSHEMWECFNPAAWFALQGQYTIENFIAGRPLWLFVEEQGRRLSSYFGNARTGKWEYHNALDRCRFLGYKLPRLLAGAEPNKPADAVSNRLLIAFKSLRNNAPSGPWRKSELLPYERRR